MSSRIRRRVTWLALLITVGALAYVLGWSHIFRVTGIAIDGLQPQGTQIISTQIKRESLIAIDQPIARVDSRVVKRALLKNQWVGDVRINRHWLSGEIHIFVDQKEPIARINSASGFLYLTSNGEIAEFPAELSKPVPELAGAYNVKSNATLAYQLLNELVGGLADAFPNQVNPNQTDPNQTNSKQGVVIRKMTIGSATSFSTSVAIGEQEILIRWGSATEIALKIKVLQGLLALPENTKLRVVDLSAPLTPIVK